MAWRGENDSGKIENTHNAMPGNGDAERRRKRGFWGYLQVNCRHTASLRLLRVRNLMSQKESCILFSEIWMLYSTVPMYIFGI